MQQPTIPWRVSIRVTGLYSSASPKIRGFTDPPQIPRKRRDTGFRCLRVMIPRAGRLKVFGLPTGDRCPGRCTGCSARLPVPDQGFCLLLPPLFPGMLSDGFADRGVLYVQQSKKEKRIGDLCPLTPPTILGPATNVGEKLAVAVQDLRVPACRRRRYQTRCSLLISSVHRRKSTYRAA